MFTKRLILVALFACLTFSPVWAQAPATIGYQGILTDANGVAVPNGAQTLTTRLYGVASGGSALWTETQSVTTISGAFSNVGIGTTNPTDKLYVVGNIVATGTITPLSSRRWKTNIQPLQGALDKVRRLRGVTYDLKENMKHQVGMIAEEVGEVIPEVVLYEENGKDAKGLDCSRLVAVLIEAVKEQQKEMEALKKQLSAISGQRSAVSQR